MTLLFLLFLLLLPTLDLGDVSLLLDGGGGIVDGPGRCVEVLPGIADDVGHILEGYLAVLALVGTLGGW